MKYFVIADLHGRYDLLDEARMRIKQETYNLAENDFKVIALGDYIDRGPQSKQVIESLMETQRLFPYMICLQGNHEAMAIESITHNLHPDWWVGNGGDATFKSYGWGGEPYTQLMYDTFPKSHLEWLKSLPLFYETEKQIFVHAGMPQWGMNVPPKNPDNIQKMQWMLYGKNDSGGWKGKHVVHGHHQFADGPHQWLNDKTGGRTDLDTWAYKTGRLVIGVFDDTQGPAKEFIEILE